MPMPAPRQVYTRMHVELATIRLHSRMSWVWRHTNRSPECRRRIEAALVGEQATHEKSLDVDVAAVAADVAAWVTPPKNIRPRTVRV